MKTVLFALLVSLSAASLANPSFGAGEGANCKLVEALNGIIDGVVPVMDFEGQLVRSERAPGTSSPGESAESVKALRAGKSVDEFLGIRTHGSIRLGHGQRYQGDEPIQVRFFHAEKIRRRDGGGQVFLDYSPAELSPRLRHILHEADRFGATVAKIGGSDEDLAAVSTRMVLEFPTPKQAAQYAGRMARFHADDSFPREGFSKSAPAPQSRTTDFRVGDTPIYLRVGNTRPKTEALLQEVRVGHQYQMLPIQERLPKVSERFRPEIWGDLTGRQVERIAELGEHLKWRGFIHRFQDRIFDWRLEASSRDIGHELRLVNDILMDEDRVRNYSQNLLAEAFHYMNRSENPQWREIAQRGAVTSDAYEATLVERVSRYGWDNFPRLGRGLSAKEFYDMLASEQRIFEDDAFWGGEHGRLYHLYQTDMIGAYLDPYWRGVAQSKGRDPQEYARERFRNFFAQMGQVWKRARVDAFLRIFDRMDNRDARHPEHFQPMIAPYFPDAPIGERPAREAGLGPYVPSSQAPPVLSVDGLPLPTPAPSSP